MLYSTPTPIVVYAPGHEAMLRAGMETVGMDSDVSWSSSPAEAKAIIAEHKPAVVILSSGNSDVSKAARSSNKNARIVCIGPSEDCEADTTLPAEFTIGEFLSLMQSQIWLYAGAKQGFRGFGGH